MNIVVNDTNIFIDLIKVNLLDEFFMLSFEIHTTDMIISEISYSGQAEIMAGICDKGDLQIKSFDFSELEKINNLSILNRNLSVQDCGVLHYSHENNYTLLTGDGLLRKTANKRGVNVRGLLFVFDQLIENKLLSHTDAIDKLNFLVKNGTRLPQNEVKIRMDKWST